jgi:hypothetical protein
LHSPERIASRITGYAFLLAAADQLTLERAQPTKNDQHQAANGAATDRAHTVEGMDTALKTRDRRGSELLTLKQALAIGP